MSFSASVNMPATINCLARPFTPLDYEKTLEAVSMASPNKQAPRIRGELGTKLLLQKVGEDGCTFWSLTPTIADGSVAEFGAGDLRFKPKIGLVSGKYAAYFGLSATDVDNIFFDLISVENLAAK